MLEIRMDPIGLVSMKSMKILVVASIWWQWTNVKDGKVQFTYDPNNNEDKARYKEGSTYKFVYFYGSGYEAVASTTFTVNREG